MRHFYSFLLLAVLSCIAGTNAWAYDFVADGIYYHITSADGLTVEVTYETTDYDSYSGDVVIPATVEYDSKTYNVTSIGSDAFYYCTGLTSIEIPSGVTRIGSEAFDSCTGLTSIELPSSVTSIGSGVFANCSGLTSITIPDGLTTLASNAFRGCTGLTSVTIPSSVENIYNQAFSGCTGLTSVEIPAGVTYLVGTVFEGCSGLTSIVVSSDNSVFDSRDNCNAIIEKSSNKLIAGCQNTVIPNSVVSIGENAFKGCSGLTSIEIPSSVTSIGGRAFHQCRGLTEIKIPSSVTYIGEWAFAYCSGLRNIEIPDNVKIDNYAFDGCNGLTEIKLPSSMTFIGNQLFNNCSGLTSLEIPNSVTSIGDFAFGNCTGLTSIEIPSGVTSIGNYAFQGCTGLANVEIPKDVATIGYDAFNNVRCVIYAGEATGSPWGAKKVYTTLPDEYGFYYTDEEKTQIEFYAGAGGDVVIPAKVTSIGSDAFSDCTGLTAIYLNSLVPPTIYYNTFDGMDLSNCTLYVPEGFESRYKSANYWKDFKNIAVNPYVTVEKKAVIYVVDGEEYHRDSVAVTLAITAIDAPTREGYTFSGWSEIPATMPDNDVTVTGTFTVNTHNVVYVVDGAEYQKVENVAFGTTLAAIDAPTREGYTFSGWSEIPATMPDNDVTVTGTFTINKYAVIYMVDGEEYRRDSVEYGATITLAENPTKESHDFSGWSGYPEDLTMPAGDVIITGGFQFNGLAGVAAATSGDEYFDLTGKPLAQPRRGINLVRKADGTTRKIIVK
ncbi:MAG: leucine-rich repeat protein [Bacteroidales bacterium]|nr:leucine-rich repeat protein [Bacteroidales bacterium]